MLRPLRRRGTEDQRIRRIRKWARRDHAEMIARHFASAWRFCIRAEWNREPHEIKIIGGRPVDVRAIHSAAFAHTVKL